MSEEREVAESSRKKGTKTGKHSYRADKGTIRTSQRDRYCISWIAEQSAVRGDQIQRLLARYPDPKHPFVNQAEELPSASTTRNQLARWKKAGWIVYNRALAEGLGWAVVTHKGLKAFGLDGLFSAHLPSIKQLEHLYAINQVRLYSEDVQEDFRWMSERCIRARLHYGRGESSGPIPDAYIFPAPSREQCAVEVQISGLTTQGWTRKISELLHAIESKPNGHYGPRYASIWIFVPSETMRDVVDKVCASLPSSEAERVNCEYQDDLLLAEWTWKA